MDGGDIQRKPNLSAATNSKIMELLTCLFVSNRIFVGQ